MRFHLVIGMYVLLFSLFYDFSPVQIALLVVLIALVVAFEALNTCIEELANLCADRYEPLVRCAKDLSAGAVLVVSTAAAAVGVIFFWNLSVLGHICGFFAENVFLLVLLVLSAAASAIFVILGPTGIKEKLILHRAKVKNKAVKK